MRYVRTRIALAIAGTATLVYLLGCASAKHDPAYDGDLLIIPSPSDSVQFVPVTITNDRSRDLVDPHFYLVGNGRHSLGIVNSLTTKRLFVDSRWLTSADGCFQIVAHYVGQGDLTYQKICWRPGEVIDVTLSALFNPVAAWSHP